MNLNDLKTLIESYGLTFLESEELLNTGDNYFKIEVEEYETSEQLTSNMLIGVYTITISIYYTSMNWNDAINYLSQLEQIVNAIKMIEGYAGFKGLTINKIDEEYHKFLATLKFNWRSV